MITGSCSWVISSVVLPSLLNGRKKTTLSPAAVSLGMLEALYVMFPQMDGTAMVLHHFRTFFYPSILSSLVIFFFPLFEVLNYL